MNVSTVLNKLKIMELPRNAAIVKITTVIETLYALDYAIYNNEHKVNMATEGNNSDKAALIYEMYYGHGVGHLEIKQS